MIPVRAPADPHPVNPARPRPLPGPPKPPPPPRPSRLAYLMAHPVGRPAIWVALSGVLILIGQWRALPVLWLYFAVTYLPADIRDLIARQGRYRYMRGGR